MRRSLALFALAFLALSTPACRRTEALKQRCVAGDTSACETACSKGISGEGGCFHAGDQHRTKASRAGGDSELGRASEYFVKSCNGGYADGCLMAAQMIEAPYTALDAAPNKAAPERIGDREILEREKWLIAACNRGSTAGCKRLGDVSIGKNAERARSAYEKACHAGAAAEACIAARGREVALAERWRNGCTHGVADDCTHLGNLLFAVDVPRAVRLFVSECGLRGVADLSGGVDAFVLSRVNQARMGVTLPDAARPPAAAAPSAPSIRVLAPKIDGQVAFVEVERLLRSHDAELASCAASLPKDSAGKVAARLVVDLTGDVYRVTTSASGVPDRVAGCMQAVLEELSLPQALPALATVDVDIVIGAPAK